MGHLHSKDGHLISKSGHLCDTCCTEGCPTKTCTGCTIPVNAIAVVSGVTVPVCQSPAACDNTDAACDELAGGDTTLARGTCPEGCVCDGGSGGGTPCPNCSHRYYFPAANGVYDGETMVATEPVINGVWDMFSDGPDCALFDSNCIANVYCAMFDSCCNIHALCGGDDDLDGATGFNCINIAAYVDPSDGKFVVVIFSDEGGPDVFTGGDPRLVFFYKKIDCPTFPVTLEDDTDYPVGSCVPGSLFGFPAIKAYKVASGGSITITCAP